MNQNDEKLISIDEVIVLAKKMGVDFGSGDPRHRLRYYTKIGLLPHAQRKSFNNHSSQGAYPESVINLLIDIDKKIKSRKTIQMIKREVREEREKREKTEEKFFESPFAPSLPLETYNEPQVEIPDAEEEFLFQEKPKIFPKHYKLNLASKILSALLIFVIFGSLVFFVKTDSDVKNLITYYNEKYIAKYIEKVTQYLSATINKFEKLSQTPSLSEELEGEGNITTDVYLEDYEPYLTINAETLINAPLTVKEQINLQRGEFGGRLTTSDLTSNRDYIFPDQSGTVCLTTGNCIGEGSTNRLAKFISAGRLGNASINDLFSQGVAITIDATGNVGIGIAFPAYDLHVDGRIQATGDICTDLNGGRCLSKISSGGGGGFFIGGSTGVQGSGSIGYLPIWTETASLGNSIVSQSGSVLNIAGTIKITGFQLGTSTTAGYALVADENGVGTWQSVASGLSGAGTANRVTFWTGTSTLSYDDSFTWDNTNKRLGIGTTTPNETLTIQGTSTVPIFGIWSSSTSPILYVNSNGNVGIGTTSPATMLQVYGRIRMNEFQLGTTATSGYALVTDASGVGTWQQVASGLSGSGSANRATFWTGTSTLSYDDSFTWDNANKRLGIGTTTPSSILEIYSVADTGTTLTITAASSTDPQIIFKSGTTPTTNFVLGVDYTDSNKFKIATSTLSADGVFIIDQLGFVGIGTTTPSTILGVQGDISGTGALTVTGSLTSSNVTVASTTLWDWTYGIVSASSTIWDNAVYISTASSSLWSLTYSIVNSSSTIWDRATYLTAASSSLWSLTYSIVNASSSVWDNAVYVSSASSTAWSNKLSSALATGNIFVGGPSGTAVATSTIYLAGGNVGIGTTTPGNKLTVLSLTEDDGIVIRESDNGNNAVRITAFNGGGRLSLLNGGVATVNFDASGAGQYNYINTGANFGIGTTSPATMLQVYGRIRMNEFQLGTTATSGYALVTDASGVGTWQQVASGLSGSGSANRATFWTGTSTLSYDDSFAWDNSNKRLGIGTSTPTSTLTVYGTSTFLGGYVGIGTTTPVSLLSVQGDITGTGALTMTGAITGSNITVSSTTLWNWTYGIVNASSSIWDNANFLTPASSSLWSLTYSIVNASSSIWDNAVYVSSASSTIWSNKLSSALATGNIFVGGPSNTAVATSTIYLAGGNVGIGTTSPATMLQVYGRIRMNEFQLGVTSTAGYALVADENGVGTWQQVASGLSGAGSANRATFWTGTSTLSYDNNFTWDNSNKMLGIGTTTPTSTLTVYGTSTFLGGKVGIGTTSPSYLLDVSGGSGIVAQFSGRVIGVDAVESNEFATLGQISTGGGPWSRNNPYVYLTVGADIVGIGTSTASSKLEIYSTSDTGTALTITAASTSDPQVVFKSGEIPSTNFVLGVDASDSNKFKIATSTIGTDDVLTIDQFGKVGIGTTSPSYLLDVSGGSGIVAQFSGRVIGADAVESNEFATLGQLSTGAGPWSRTDPYVYLTVISDLVGIGTSTPTSTLTVYGTSTFLGGYVGIGTTTPVSLLSVQGDITGTGALTMTGSITGSNITVSSTTLWNWTYGIVSASSSVWDNAVYVSSASSSYWSLAYSILSASSSIWDNANFLTQASSSLWSLTYSIVNASSSIWDNAVYVSSASSTIWSNKLSNALTLGNIFVGDPSNTAVATDTIFLTGGKVGIGTTSPSNLLDVFSSAASHTYLSITNTNVSDLDVAIKFQLAADTPSFTMGVDDSDGDKFKIGTATVGASTRLTIDSNGLVGIGSGATNPTAVLHVVAPNAGSGEATEVLRVIGGQAGEFATGSAITLIAGAGGDDTGFLGPGNGGNITITAGTGGQGTDIPGGYGGHVIINGGAGGTGSGSGPYGNVLLSTAGGNVGIGTTSPATMLQVYGRIRMNEFQLGTTATSGYALVTDANGVGTWQQVASGLSGAGSANRATFWTGTSTLSYDNNFTWDNSNKMLGIGTTTPTSTLTVYGTSTFMGGNVGIGTTSPAYKLEVMGSTPTVFKGGVSSVTFKLRNSGYDEATIGTGFFEHDAYGDLLLGATRSSGDLGALRLYAGNSERVTILGGGNVGIGTTTPTSPLQIGSTASGNLHLSGNAAFAPYNAEIAGVYQSEANPRWALGRDLAGGGISALAFGGGAASVLDTYIYRPSASHLRIDSNGSFGAAIVTISGNVGIGTTTPVVKLDINDSVAGNYSLALVQGQAIGWRRSNGDLGGASIIGNSDTEGRLILQAGGSGEIVFNTGGTFASGNPSHSVGITERMRITGTGLVGIGTTSPATMLQVYGRARMNEFQLGTTATSGYALVTDANGVGTWQQVASGLSGAGVANRATFWSATSTLSYDDSFTWDNTNKRLGIGTTTPTSTLTVYGTSTFLGGNVGIGTTEPLVKLDVVGTIRANNGTIYASDSATPGAGNVTYISQNGTVGVVGTSYFSGAPTPLTFTIAAIEKMRLDTTGYVGIGTTSPATMLQVYGRIRMNEFQLGTTATSGYALVTDASGVGTWQQVASGLSGSGSANRATFWSATSTLSYDDSFTWDNTNKRLGIGTTTPTSTLTVYGTSTFLGGNVGIGTTTPATLFTVATTSNIFNVLSNGNVGIGTAGPNYKLDVNGAIRDRASADSSPYTQGRIFIYGGEGVDATNWGYLAYSDTAITRLVYGKTASGGFALSQSSATNGTGTVTDRLYVDNLGNVGIGTTTPATLFTVATTSNIFNVLSNGNVGIGTASPGSPLDIGTATANGALRLRSGDTTTFSNGYNQFLFSYAGSQQYITHAVKTRHNDGADAGNSIDFYVWDYGTDATNAIGTKQVMSLNGGNVGIGTTSPANLLDVYGNMGLGNQGQARFYEATSSGSNYVAFSATTSLAGNSTYYWPAADGTAAQVLKTSGGGTLYWAADTGGSSLDTWVINGTTMYATDTITYLGIGTTTPTSTLTVYGTSTFLGGYVGIGTTTPAAPLSVQGNISGTGTLEMTSSITGSNITVSSTTLWNWTYGLANASSSIWDNAVYVSSASSSYWSQTYSIVSASSSIWDNANFLTSASSSLWSLTYSIVDASSSVWDNAVYVSSASSTIWSNKLSNALATGNIFVGSPSGTAVATSTMYLAGGNVGIGTTSPSSLLELYSTANAGTALTITAASSTDPKIVFKTGAVPATKFVLGVDYSDSNKFKIATSTIGTDDVFVIDQNGYVGIGTSSPQVRLHIGTASSTHITSPSKSVMVSGDLEVVENAYFGPMRFPADSGVIYWIDMTVSTTVATSTIESYTARLGGTDVLTIYGEAAGVAGGVTNTRVGIGTTSPSAKLTVSGDFYVSATTTLGSVATSTPVIFNGYVKSNINPFADNTYALGSASYRWSNIYAATATIGSTLIFGSDIISGSATTTLTTAAGSLILNPSGNVGIGTTTPTSLFTVATTSNIFNVLSNGTVGISSSTPAAALGVQGDIRGTGALTMTGAITGSNITAASSTLWSTAYGIVNASSTNWDTSYNNALNVSTASSTLWSLAYGIVNASSTNWDTSYYNALNVSTASSTLWSSAYGIVNSSLTVASSTLWSSAYGIVNSSLTAASSSLWSLTYSIVNASSSIWDNAIYVSSASSTIWSNKLSSALATGNIFVGGPSGTAVATSTIYLAGGNVGIGTTTLSHKFSVDGSASLGSGAEVMRISVDGNVGIGTTTPTTTLQVYGTSTFLGGNVGIGTTSPNHLLTIGTAGSATSTYRLGVYGSIRASGSIDSLQSFDIAERFPINFHCNFESTCPEKGDVVSIAYNEVVEKSSVSYDSKLVGVVTEGAAITMGGLDASSSRPVALAGRLPVKISLENGPIQVGDLLTSASTIPGAAMKATEQGRVIGMALEDYDGTGSTTDKILMFINPHWYSGEIAIDGSFASTTDGTTTENGTSTEESGILDEFVQRVKDALASLGLFIENGIAQIKGVITDNLFAKKARIERLEMVDKSTGDIYCTWIENGEWQKTKGECADEIAEQPDETPVVENPPSEPPSEPPAEEPPTEETPIEEVPTETPTEQTPTEEPSVEPPAEPPVEQPVETVQSEQSTEASAPAESVPAETSASITSEEAPMP